MFQKSLLPVTDHITGHSLVPDIAREFRLANPNIRVDLAYLHSPAQRDKILQDQIDFGFVETSFQSPEIETSPIAHHRLVVLLPPKHQLAAKDSLTLEELPREQRVMRAHSE